MRLIFSVTPTNTSIKQIQRILFRDFGERITMRQISISDIQRNLHKLDDFDMIEIIDKKRNKVKGYFIESKYASFVEELSQKVERSKKPTSLRGVLHRYANNSKHTQEENAWKQHLMKKHSKND